MAVTLMTMLAKLGLDTSGFTKGMDQASGKASKGSSSITKSLGKIAGVVASAFAVKKIIDFGESMVNAAMDAENKLAELNAVIASTKGVSGMTSEAVLDIADSLSKVTAFEDDAIVAGESMLLTFTNIGKDVFPQATETMLNMAQKFGGIESASIQLGKALNDPITGVTALRRVGVMLTDEQEEQIKSFMAVGDIASAQAVILGELETEFGGLAKAMGQTTLGKITRFKNAFGNLKETLGNALLPTIGKIAGAFADFLNKNMPKISAFATKVANWLGGAFDKVWNAGKRVIDIVQGISFSMPAAVETIKQLLTTGDSNGVAPLINLMSTMGMNVEDARKWGENIGLVAQGFGQLSTNVPPDAWAKLGVPQWVIDGVVELKDVFGDIGGVLTTAIKGLASGQSLKGIWEDALPSLDTMGNFAEGAPGLKTQLTLIGKQMLGYIGEGLKDIGIFLIKLDGAVKAWARSEAVQTAVAGFGKQAGAWMLNGFLMPFETPGEGDTKLINGVEGMVGRASKDIGKKALSLGQVFFDNFMIGLNEAAFERLKNLIPGLKPASGPIPGYDPSLWPSGAPFEIPGVTDVMGANGFNGIVTRPTRFLAGEAGPEQVTITPNGKQGNSGASITHIWNIRSTDPKRTADEVRNMMLAQGIA